MANLRVTSGAQGRAAASPPARDRGLAGKIRLVAMRGPLKGRGVTIALEGPPDISGGVGGWQTFDRPQRKPGRWWAGATEMTMSISGMLDRGIGGDGGISVVDRLERLRAFGAAQAGEDEPPPIRLEGDLADPYNLRAGRWVIQGISYGERLFDRMGNLHRQSVTVELADYDDIPSIKAVTVRRTRGGVSKGRTRTIRTHKNDTLRQIAIRELGYSAGWQDLRDWNERLFKGAKSVGPDDPLKAGLVVKIK